ncbi:MAG TPA: N-acetylmuramoyl-L-alanine amidase [Flavobacteriales bacterium]|jgi:N-acetylmuramoyl-L-alanine amidase|nr:N-acetylmuramoyl-L-alanine amidase [Flavobacteriales bacterium]|tara:strand:+ start:3435 stop:4715 length:1281 start_codon:yes stop_codon:yes gene_type:complete
MFIVLNLKKIYNFHLLNLQRIIIVFLLITIVVFPSQSQNANNGIKKIVIDPGHGGKDPGNLGTGRYKETEKHIALDISLLFGNYVKEAYPDIEIIYTRKTNDKFLELHERTQLANDNNADLFISIHCDAWTNPNAYGAGVYVMGMSKLKANMGIAIKENAVIYLEDDYKQNYEGFDPNTPESYIVFSLTQNTYLGQSLQIAEEVEQQFATRANRKSRGVKQAPFYVISRANMPSILIETGFLTNPKEEDYLNSNEGKTYIASAIFRAFRSYKESIEQASKQISNNQEVTNQKKANQIPDKECGTELYMTPEQRLIYNQTRIDRNSWKKEIVKQDTVIDSKQDIIFKVQIGTYLKEMKSSEKFQGLEVEQQIINGTYKYFVGNTPSKRVADKLRIKMVERGFNGAFIVALKDGIRINVKEALSLQNQ